MSEDAKMILCFPSLWGFEFTFWMLEKHIHRTDAAILFVAIMSPIIFVTILPLMFLQMIAIVLGVVWAIGSVTFRAVRYLLRQLRGE